MSASEQEDSLWSTFWRTYLVWANRGIAAASNLYFFAVVRDHFENPVLADVILVLYTLVLGELLGLVIERRYKPRFVRAGARPSHERDDGTLILSEADYRYRTSAEKSLYETWALYLLNATVSVILCTRRGEGYAAIGLGAIGLFASFFTLAGVAIACSTDTRTGKTSPLAVLFGLILVAPGVAYVLAALWHVGLP